MSDVYDMRHVNQIDVVFYNLKRHLHNFLTVVVQNPFLKIQELTSFAGFYTKISTIQQITPRAIQLCHAVKTCVLLILKQYCVFLSAHNRTEKP